MRIKVRSHVSGFLLNFNGIYGASCIENLPSYRKHEKRHIKPYGCTFPDCARKFGSKNDWKRHENSQHYMLEHWRCDEKSSDNPAEVCGKVVQRRELFKQHLDSCHLVRDPATLDRKLEACRVGRTCDTRFWCGFCLKIVETADKPGVNPWTERFNHIDDHFHGRSGQEKREIADWREEEQVVSSRPSAATDSAESVANESEDAAAAAWSTPVSSSAHSSDVPGPEKLRVRSANSKRKRDDVSDAHVSKRATTSSQPRYHCVCNLLPTPSPFSLTSARESNRNHTNVLLVRMSSDHA